MGNYWIGTSLLVVGLFLTLIGLILVYGAAENINA